MMGILGLAALALLIWQWVLAPRFNEPAAVQAKVTTALQTKGSIDEAAATLTNRARLINTAIREGESVSAALPANANIADLYTQIADVARASGISPSAIDTFNTDTLIDESTVKKVYTNKSGSSKTSTPTPSATPDPKALTVYSMNVTVRISGSYAQLMKFLNGIQDAPRAITVDKVVVAKNNNGRFSMEMHARAFAAAALPAAPTAGSNG
jgi:Tfp pilus assembly protein PilO